MHTSATLERHSTAISTVSIYLQGKCMHVYIYISLSLALYQYQVSLCHCMFAVEIVYSVLLLIDHYYV